MSMSSCYRALLLILAVLVASCSTLQSQDRPVYTIKDNVGHVVGHVEPEQLVGTWIATELNPVAGNEPQSTTIEYHDNGVVTSIIELQMDSRTQPDDIAFELSGQWRVDRNVITHYDMQLKSLDDSDIGLMLSQLVNEQTQLSEQSGISGEATIAEVSANRMIMLGTDGVAMEYKRD